MDRPKYCYCGHSLKSHRLGGCSTCQSDEIEGFGFPSIHQPREVIPIALLQRWERQRGRIDKLARGLH